MIATALAPKTIQAYSSIINSYRDYVCLHGENDCDPSEEIVCRWVGYESLFIDPASVEKYVQAIAYYLDTYGKKGGIKTVLVKRLIRSASMKYGLPVKDDKENVTIDLLLGIMKKIKLWDALDLCCMAASIIGFLNCLRCVEFTLHQQSGRFLKRKDWKQDETRGQIFLPYSKTDITGRGHWIKYRKMKSNLDPIFWMRKHADSAKSRWLGTDDDPLFILPSGKPLDRKTLLDWLRKMSAKAGHPKPEKLSGVSFRRGGAQALRDQGYSLDELGRLGRWKDPRSAARYLTLTDAVVDEFAASFDTADKTLNG